MNASSSSPTPPRLKAIVAYSRNRTIGKDNALPWRLPSDLKHFKQVTLGSPVIMGRKTWESIGRPLPGRLNIVMSRALAHNALPGATVVNSVEQALSAAHGHPHAFIIGGADLYAQALDRVDEIIATEIDADIDGDAHFPVLDPAIWRVTEHQPQGEENGFSYAFVTYQRIAAPA